MYLTYIFETKSTERDCSTASNYDNVTHKARLWRNKTLQNLEDTKCFN